MRSDTPSTTPRGIGSTRRGVVIIIETGNRIKSSLPAAPIIEDKDPQEVEEAALYVDAVDDPQEDAAEIPAVEAAPDPQGEGDLRELFFANRHLGVSVYLGYDGVVYVDQRRKKILDQKIKALEVKLTRLRKLRRELS